jgi:DNA adenine methylase
MIYLNKTCFNGLYRVNSSGFFNVPFNGKLVVNTYSKENLMNLHELLSQEKIVILNGDFELAVKGAKAGDFIFFDPPYDLLKEDSFDSYNKDAFGVEGQKRLARIAHELNDKGCYVMITNHNTKLINELYSDFTIDIINVKRMINSDASNRVGVETIIYNY